MIAAKVVNGIRNNARQEPRAEENRDADDGPQEVLPRFGELLGVAAREHKLKARVHDEQYRYRDAYLNCGLEYLLYEAAKTADAKRVINF